ncbi:MAG: zinc-ribbon domain-containing protein [Deltaproteobacteria bacterium]|nr:zinc-ribbon domain-containing protein [Deltaproteobacteria bacterium]
MIIPCPNCATKFHLDESRIPEGGAKARCSRCRHIFTVQKAEPPKALPPIIIPEPIIDRAGLRRRAGRRPAYLAIALVAIFIAGGLFAWENIGELEKAWTGLSTLKQYLGLWEEKEGKIILDKLRGYYAENNAQGRLFIVEGIAINQWNEPRSFIRVKGILMDIQGRKVQEKTVYCGNIISEKDLKEMSKEVIQKSLSSQFGISFSNMNIPSGKSVPFMIVFGDFPPLALGPKAPAEKAGEASADLSDFTVEVVSSQKGSKSK